MFSIILSLLLIGHPNEEVRLGEIAQSIREVSVENPIKHDPLDTSLMLIAIARHESGLSEDVRRCRVKGGDNGRSISLYQLMRGMSWFGHSKDEICSSDKLQAELALRVLHVHHKRCPKCGVKYLFRAYASGDGGMKTRAAEEIYEGYMYLKGKIGLEE